MPTYTPQIPENSSHACVPPGLYEVEILNAVEKNSQSGNPMIVLTLGIEGGPEIRDFLVFSQKTFWKIDQCLASLGQTTIPGEPISVEPSDLFGATGLAEIGQEAGIKNPNQQYNCLLRWVFGEERKEWLRTRRVQGFVARQAAPRSAPPAQASDDDIPF
jgi:hypothetical protein